MGDTLDDALKGLDEFLQEINKYSLSDSDMVGVKYTRTKKQISNLDSSFWEEIRQQISTFLVQNYNRIRILNDPKYYKWKQRARENSLNVEVASGVTRQIVYIRPALRTGYLRDRLRDVKLNHNNIDPRNPSAGDLVYEVELGDLQNDYGAKFAELVKQRTGNDILGLTEEQVDIILSMIVSKYEEGA